MGESCGEFGQKTLTCSAAAQERISRPASAPTARDHGEGRRDVQVILREALPAGCVAIEII